MKTKSRIATNFLLSLTGGILFGISFPPMPFGTIACVSLIPMFILIEIDPDRKSFFRYSYLMFLTASVISLYWVGGFTHRKDQYLMMAGTLLLIWQPFYCSLPFIVYRYIKKKSGVFLSLASFPFIWIAFEWLYAWTEFAFPWLTIGNTQTYDLARIQFIEITGVYGLSFWVVAMNILLFLLAVSILKHQKKNAQIAFIVIITIVMYSLPYFYRSEKFPPSGKKEIKVGVIQPNIDPWDKWAGTGNSFAHRWNQVEEYLGLSRKLLADSARLIVWPESAILFNIPEYHEPFSKLKSFTDSLGGGLVSGFMKVQYYVEGKAPPSSSVIAGTNTRYDAFNAILSLQSGKSSIQYYSKMKLVPFAERIPFADQVPFLIEPLRWNVGASNWGMGKDSTIFIDSVSGTKFLSMVCYESIFPEFVSSFVKRGAEFLIFITNDSWWGNTSGARQHQRYAVLRAVENRRWVVRCANGGISCFIDPSGAVYDQTELYSTSVISRVIYPSNDHTFYTEHGDIIGKYSAIVTAIICFMLMGISIVKKYQRKKI